MTNVVAEPSLRQKRAVIVLEHIDAEHERDATVATFAGTEAVYEIPGFGPPGLAPDHQSSG